MLSQVSVLMHYDSFDNFLENQRAEMQTEMNSKDTVNAVDISLACKIFPSIKLGSSPPVELYDETVADSDVTNLLAAQSYDEYFSISTGEKSFDQVVCETKPPGHNPLPDVNTSILREDNYFGLPMSPQAIILKTEMISCDQNVIDYSEHVVTELQLDVAPNELLLDKCISCLPGLSKRLCRQLENHGFHTVRGSAIDHIKSIF